MTCNLEVLILDAIHRAAREEIEAESERAAERVKQIMREKTAAILLHVTKSIEFQTHSDRLVVTIHDRTEGDKR